LTDNWSQLTGKWPLFSQEINMNTIKNTTSAGREPLSDEEMMDLLIRVRNGELSPEEAERLLSGLPGLEADFDARTSSHTEQKPAGQTEGHAASAPLGQAKRGTLIVDALAAHFTLGSAELGADLFRARYDRSFPSVWVDGNTVTARFNYFSLGALRGWLQQSGGDPRAEFTLNTAIPWQLELRSHLSHLDVNLRGLRLTGLEGDGNMNHVTLVLDAPVGYVPLRYNGNACALEIRYPAQSPLRLEVHGNTNSADVAGRKFASKSAWQTPDFDTAPDRYSIVLTGEASSLTITHA
jgi:hypothetical protein